MELELEQGGGGERNVKALGRFDGVVQRGTVHR